MQSRCFTNIPKIAVAVTVALMLAFMPFSVNLNKFMVTLERNEAHAIAPVFAGASAFLAEMATAAGFASSGEFVATIVGATTVATGMGLATDAGVRYGTDAAQNVNNLVDASDYPAWDTLSSTDKANWGSQENYDSAKFNSLMAAYGLDGAYERYQSAWGSGGAGNFSFSQQEQSSLEQIGDVGENWANGIANTWQDVNNLILTKTAVYSYFGETVAVDTTDTGMQLPAGLNQSIYGTITNGGNIKVGSRTIYVISDSEVTYTWLNMNNNGAFIDLCSKTQFKGAVGSNQQPQQSWLGNATERTVNGKTFYSYSTNWGSYGQPSNATMPNIGTITSGPYTTEITNVEYLLLYGEYVSSAEPTVPNYPQQPSDILPTTNIYYPTVVIETTPWEDYLTIPSGGGDNPSQVDLSQVIALLQHIDNDIHNLNIPGEPNLQPIINYIQHIDTDLHKFTFYQSGELKVHDEGVFTELSDINELLLEISGKMKNWGDISDAPDLIGDFDFDDIEEKVPDLLETISELAPFGSILLLSEMYTILSSYTQIENPELVFPFDFGGFDEQNHELVIDLSWLEDIRPLINFFCIAMLIIAIANATIRIVEIEAAS